MYTPSHFTALVLFALFASIVFGITQRSQTKAMVRYGLFCFIAFVGSGIVLSWLMALIAH